MKNRIINKKRNSPITTRRATSVVVAIMMFISAIVLFFQDGTIAYPEDPDRIYGFLWVDGDGTLPTDWDGIYNGEEQPLKSYPVFLYTESDLDDPITQTKTDETGTYAFEHLEPGSYIVGISSATLHGTEYLLPLSETDNDESMLFSDVIVLIEGESVEGISVGLRLLADETEEPADTTDETEEPADTTDETEEPADTTDETEEPADTTDETEEPADTTDETEDPSDENKGSGEPSTVDYANSIGGYLWLDLEKTGSATPPNGLWDIDEEPIFNYPVLLYREEDYSAPVAETTTSNFDGWYEFFDIEPGSYVLGVGSTTVDSIEYLVPTDKTAQNNFAANPATDPTIAYTDAIVIGEDTILTDINCAMHNPAAIMRLANEMDVTNSTEWEKAIETGSIEFINVKNDIYLGNTTKILMANRPTNGSGVVTIRADKEVTIVSRPIHSLDNDISRHFIVQSLCTRVNKIVFENVTLSGNIDSGGIHSAKSGELTISGYNIINCKTRINTDGGAIEAKGNLILNDGNIDNCQATRYGGGIFSEGSVTLNGYKITGCFALRGGGIYTTKDMILGDGEISVCKLGGSSQGGGAYAKGNMTISGNAIIKENWADAGAGVYSWGKMSISNGIITENNGADGAGVYSNGELTISGNAVISYNYARTNIGAGVFANAKVFMSGGKIEGNYGVSRGAGVYVNEEVANNSFIMTGGEIVNNHAESTGSNWGGGVFSNNIEISGGVIKDNGAAIGGGLFGVNVTISGNAVIENNKATGKGRDPQVTVVTGRAKGGGIYASKSLIVEGDAKIIGNYLESDGIYVNKTGDNLIHIDYRDKPKVHYGSGVYAATNFEMRGGLIEQNYNDCVGTTYGGGVFTNAFKMTGGAISNNKSGFGGGAFVDLNGVLNITGGEISGNEATKDGGGIFTTDFFKTTIGPSPNVTFSGNTALNGAFRLELYDNIDENVYNPGTAIKVSQLKALHGPTAAIKATDFSSAPDGNIKRFMYLANNYDLNFNGENLKKTSLPPTPGYISDVNFGLGKIPMKITLFGLSVPNPGKYAALSNHVINPDASDVTSLEINVESPKEAPWTLKLNCSPFVANGAAVQGVVPVAVDYVDGVLTYHDLAGSALTVYRSSDFNNDLNNGRATYSYNNNTESFVGSWTWDKLLHEIKVEAHTGSDIVTASYQSVFTWSIVVAP